MPGAGAEADGRVTGEAEGWVTCVGGAVAGGRVLGCALGCEPVGVRGTDVDGSLGPGLGWVCGR